VPEWRCRASAGAARAAAIEADHVGQHAALVEEDQTRRVDRAYAFRLAPPRLTRLGDVLAILLGGAQAQLLSRPAGPAQRPMHRAQMHPHARPLR
jgi:hypothetical protein